MNKVTMRCAIYTRKSTDEGLEKEFNSLDAQREAAEAFIQSQKSEGWTCLDDRYDDGGYSGGTIERPALKRLMGDVEAGKVNCIVVYKVDRLSRSLMDFARMMEVLEKHHVSFVSVTQHFNTAHSMGRLTLNILLSFAQFEREIIAERTHDKIVAEKRKGRWMGGRPFLGYDIEDNCGGLVVNENEADQVRQVFALYLETGSLSQTVSSLNGRNWRLKKWINQAGQLVGGGRFTKSTLHRLLTNVAYLGKLTCGPEVFAGRHKAIITQDAFDQVQRRLQRNDRIKRKGAQRLRNRHHALLKGLLVCADCGQAMMHCASRKNGTRLYRYYVCNRAMKEGWHLCPTKSVPAGELEKVVLNQVRQLGTNAGLRERVLREFQARQKQRESELHSRQIICRREQQRLQNETAKAAKQGGTPERFSLLDEQGKGNEQELQRISAELMAIRQQALSEHEIAQALEQFDPVWNSLAEDERCKLFATLIEKVSFHGITGELTISFHDCGIRKLQQFNNATA